MVVKPYIAALELQVQLESPRQAEALKKIAKVADRAGMFTTHDRGSKSSYR